jgi:hypothetical protein
MFVFIGPAASELLRHPHHHSAHKASRTAATHERMPTFLSAGAAKMAAANRNAVTAAQRAAEGKPEQGRMFMDRAKEMAREARIMQKTEPRRIPSTAPTPPPHIKGASRGYFSTARSAR